MMRYLKYLTVVLALSLAAACGGGGGSAGTTSTGGGGGGTTPTTPEPTTPDASVASYVHQLDKNTLSNSGSDQVVLTVVTLNGANNPVAGATVAVALDSGVYTPGSTVTNANGQASGTITIGGNKTDRNITATIKVNNVSKTVVIPVVGSKVIVTPVPATPAPGASVRLDIRVEDSGGIGIPAMPVTLSGSAGFTGTVTTDVTGNVSVTRAAPLAAGQYVISAAASGTTGSKGVQVVSSTGTGAIPVAVGAVAAASLNANPTSIAPNAAGTTVNRARLSAKFLTTGNAGIANMRVRFEMVAPVLGAGEFISTGDALVYSDSAGLAEADYVSGTRTSPTNGVTVRACYSNNDFAVGTCPNSVVATLTVNSQPLSISIGNFNLLEKGGGGIAYVQKFLIQVADSSGVAVRDAVVSASVDITHFGKGTWGLPYPGLDVAPDITLDYGDTTTMLVPTTVTVTTTTTVGTLTTVTTTTEVVGTQTAVIYSPNLMPNAFSNVWCVNEDTNRNGFVELGEDINGTGALEPVKSEIVLSYVTGNKTDQSGQLLIQVSYPQNVGGWLAYTIKATTSVVGSEGTRQRSFMSEVLAGDVPNGSFLEPPYGRSTCASRN